MQPCHAMFNLEEKISEWRRQMLAAGIQSPVPLDELENHLREEIERLVKSGIGELKAFEISVQQIGQPQILVREFKKSERHIVNGSIIVAVGIFILLLGTTMVLPALGKHKQRNQEALSAGASFSSVKWADDEKFGLALGAAIVFVGAGTTAFGFKKRKA